MIRMTDNLATWMTRSLMLLIAFSTTQVSAQKLIPAGASNQPFNNRQQQLRQAAMTKEQIRLKRDLIGDARDRYKTVEKLLIREARSHLRFKIRENVLKRNWLDTETKTFMRMTGITLDDLKDSYDDRKKLLSSSKGAARFSNGSQSRRNRADFVDLSWQMSQTPAVRDALAKPIGSIEADSFGSHLFGEIVLANADLKQLPDSLRRSNGERLHDNFVREWQATVSDLRVDRSVPTGRVDRMLDLVKELKRIATQSDAVLTPAAKAYLRDCEALVYTLVNDKNRPELVKYIRDSGHAFPGGTTNELLRHVLNHQLTIRTGGDAHLALAQYTHAIIEGADSKAKELDHRVERLKQQLPGNNAVMRERLVPIEFGASTDRRYIPTKAPWDLESKGKKD